VREHLFGEQAYEVVLWYRTLHYKFTGARQIVQQLLAVDSSSLSDMVFPGELAERAVKLPPLDNVRSKHFYLLDCAPWCAKLKHTLESGLPGLVIELGKPGAFVKKQGLKTSKSTRNLMHQVRNNMARRASAVMHNLHLQAKAYKNMVGNHQKKEYANSLPACAMLVPLHKDTLLNPGVQDDLFEAIHANMKIVMLHMQEEEYGAAPFATFFEQCPDNLRDAGLFDTLACTWHFQEPYCTVSTKLLAMKLEEKSSAGSRGCFAVIREAAGTIKKDIKKNVSIVDTKKHMRRAVVPTDDAPAENDKPCVDMETGDAPEWTPVRAIKINVNGRGAGYGPSIGVQDMSDAASAALPTTMNPTADADDGNL
jgi:hypothetical protein